MLHIKFDQDWPLNRLQRYSHLKVWMTDHWYTIYKLTFWAFCSGELKFWSLYFSNFKIGNFFNQYSFALGMGQNFGSKRNTGNVEYNFVSDIILTSKGKMHSILRLKISQLSYPHVSFWDYFCSSHSLVSKNSCLTVSFIVFRDFSSSSFCLTSASQLSRSFIKLFKSSLFCAICCCSDNILRSEADIFDILMKFTASSPKRCRLAARDFQNHKILPQNSIWWYEIEKKIPSLSFFSDLQWAQTCFVWRMRRNVSKWSECRRMYRNGETCISQIYVFSYFPFGFEGRMWALIVSVPDHCLSFYFDYNHGLRIEL